MKRNKWLLMLVLMFTLALVIAGCGSDNNDSSANGGDNNGNNNDSSNNDGGEIVIGVPQPITGPSAAEGQDMVNGAELAVKHINDNGGILGREVKMIVEDLACDPQVAVTAANKLVKENVDAIVGHYCSGAALPATPIYNKAGIPAVLVGANSPQLPEQGFDNVFLINSMVSDQSDTIN